MTTPEPKQKNTKAWIATIGSLIGAMVPLLGQVAGFLPAPYGAVLSAIVGLIGLVTGGATYQVNNAPKGTVLTPVPVAKPDGTFGNPYKQA